MSAQSPSSRETAVLLSLAAADAAIQAAQAAVRAAHAYISQAIVPAPAPAPTKPACVKCGDTALKYVTGMQGEIAVCGLCDHNQPAEE